MRRTLKKWRNKTPNQHRSYGEKRNRDERIIFNYENDKIYIDEASHSNQNNKGGQRC